MERFALSDFIKENNPKGFSVEQTARTMGNERDMQSPRQGGGSGVGWRALILRNGLPRPMSNLTISKPKPSAATESHRPRPLVAPKARAQRASRRKPDKTCT
jgi:hypothetical protein